MPLSVDRTAKRHYQDEHGRYWSVSQVCEVLTGGCEYYAPGSADRGTDLHQIFALRVGASMGWCEMPDLPEVYQGYDLAIQRWIEAKKPQPTMLERRLRHQTLPYAGQMDYIGMIGPDYGVLDLKTGSKATWHSVQLHAYKQLIDKASKMWILYIDDTGTFSQVPVKWSARDWAGFQNALSVLQWRG